jgi:GntR family transcriptional regulator
LSTRLEEAPHLVVEGGDHPLAGRDTYRLVRVGSVGGEPVLVETLWFDAEVFPFFDQVKVAGASLSEAVHERYGMEATGADQTFAVAELGKTEARLLSAPVGSAVLSVERRLHFRAGRGVVVARMLCRTHRFRFSQHIGEAPGIRPEGEDA